MPHPSSAFERGQCATGTSAAASAAISPSSSATQWAQSRSGPSTSSSVPDRPLARGRNEDVRGRRKRPGTVLEPLVLAVALRQVRPDGDPEREAVAVDLERARVRRVR